MRNELKQFLLATAIALILPCGVAHGEGAGIEWDILNKESLALESSGNYARGILVAEKALEVAEKNVGPNHPDTATSLNNLASLYDDQGEYVKAEPLYKRSLEIREKVLGPNHPDVAVSLNNLAYLYRATNRAGEAAALEERAAKIRAIKR